LSSTFTDVFNAGLWDAPEAAWQGLIQSLCREGTVVRVTETTHVHPAAPKGWARVWFSKPGAYECSLYYDVSEWAHIDSSAEQIAQTRYALGGKALKPALHALCVLLEHRATGKRVLFVTIHEPSAIEEFLAGDPGAGNKYPRIRALFEGLTGTRRAVRKYRKAHGRFATVIGADWNLDVHKPWVRAFLKAHFPSYRLSWHALPNGGDHGNRLISASLYSRGLITKGSVLGRHTKPFDHARFTTEYRFRKARKR
jgi:hypothetical protein